MKHTYNNWSTDIFEGFYKSNLWNSDSLYWIEESDRQEGYLNDNEEYDIDDFEAFTKEVSENAVYFLFEALDEHDVIKDMKFKDLYSPKYYNYETDSLIIDVDVDMRKLKKYCFTTKKEAFNQYLKDNFTSCDGFISYISNNIKDFKEDYNQPSNNKEINVMIEFYLLTQINNSDSEFDRNTNYHYRLYDSLNETIWNHLKTVEAA